VGRDLVQVREGTEGAAIEQIFFDIPKRSLDFTFRLSAGGGGKPTAGSRSAWQRPKSAGCRSAARRQ
jgi:hypothetical protein